MRFADISLRWKIVLVLLALFLPASVGGAAFVFQAVKKQEAYTALSGLMNFVDAKQQGVIRFLGQNEKLAKQLAIAVDTAPPKSVYAQFQAIVQTDTFDVDDHPFRDEIEQGKRSIATWQVYHAIDYVVQGIVTVSSDPQRIGRKISKPAEIERGYSEVYMEDDVPLISFGAQATDGWVYVHAKAKMLTILVNGEIGNLEGDMGAYYLAGVGKTFDYYITNRENIMITDSRVYPDAMLSQKGSWFPWMMTMGKAVDMGLRCLPDGTYETNAGHFTGQREAMGFYDGPDGKERIGVSMPFYDSFWTIVVEQESSELLQPTYDLMIRLAIGAGLTVFLLVAAGIALSRQVTKPLAQAMGDVEKLSSGNTDISMDYYSGNDEVGHLTSALRVFRDNIIQKDEISKQHRQAAKEADSANQAKSAFLASMSHEIRTPMNGVIGMLDVLMHSRMSTDDRKMVDTIRHSASSLLGIIDDILDFSKIEAGKLDLSNHPMMVEQEFDAVCNLLDRVALDKQVELTMFFDPEIPEVLIGDALRLRQILTNLTNNALKFSSGLEHVGRVYLRADLDHRDEDQVRILFSVNDNGIGIEDETLARLFTPFEQAEGGTTRTYGGTGLGLVISQNLAGLMGGQIEVQSEVGKGSTFSVCLPFSIGETDDGTPPPYGLSGIEAVVVCDDPKYVQDYTRYLTHAEARVYTVEELKEGWELISRRNLSEPICFMVMEEPGLESAQEIVDRLIAGQPDRDVRIVHVAYLSIERGKRRTARKLSENVIQIDREVLTRRRLLNAVALSTGRVTLEEMIEVQQDQEYGDLAQQQTREEAIKAGRLILVAEDNETNLDVIQRQLKILGFTVDLTKDGVEAYEKWQSGDYGLLLTDIHMPKRDGYELTTCIRQDESEQEIDRIPIIALTANALKGEEDRCLEIGMDGYLTKPVELNLLKEALQRWLPSLDDNLDQETNETTQQASEQETSHETSEQAVDPSILTQIVGDDPALHRQFLEKFIEPASQTISEIHAAFEAGSSEQIGELGHKLKSSSRTIGANALADLCAELEIAGKADDWSRIKTLHSQLDKSFDEVKTFIENH